LIGIRNEWKPEQKAEVLLMERKGRLLKQERPVQAGKVIL